MAMLFETMLNRPLTSEQAAVRSSLGVFDGTTDFLVHKAQFESAGTKANWSDYDKCFHLAQQLRGSATKVYGNLLRLGVSITYQLLREHLDKQFTQRMSSAQARSILRSTKQGPEQSVSEFTRELEQAGRAYFVNVPENYIQEHLFEWFVKGLPDPKA